ncbi:outer membrane protein [Ciceribacter thiooxidans]|uniref:Outer membrane protein n=1 Tax=Ciceribacter thiooxidans TaxID=1969821 RepID=A0ABV7I6S8_9HYPH|nr:outer membrane beta-barrel protein [Ciceribacter thiooxidans]
MKPARLFTVSVLALAALAGSARADDKDLIDAPEVDITAGEPTAGLYLRADLGYSPWTGDDDASYRFNDAGGALLNSGDFDDSRFGKPLSGGAGIGYQFNDLFRADLTGEFFEGTFEGSGRTVQPCSGAAPAGTGCSYGGKADFRAYGLMANGYVDLLNVSGFTPYVGAGIGATHVAWGTFNASASCVDGSGACGGATFADARYGGEDGWRFTYALMAGVSYSVSDRVKLDIGYRFSDIAGGAMFSGGSSGEDAGLRRHEFRAGVRVSLW